QHRSDRRPVAQGKKDFAAEVGPGVERSGDVVDVLGADAAGRQAVADRLRREAGPMLDAVEPFLLDRGDELAIDDQGGGRVAVKGVDAEDVHEEPVSVAVQPTISARASASRSTSSAVLNGPGLMR